MKIFKLHLALFATIGLLASSVGWAETKTPMSSKALKALIAGTVVHGTNTGGNKFIQVFGKDGSLQSGYSNNRNSDNKWIAREVGTWKVSKGRLCNSYTKPKKRSGGCDRFYKTSKGRYVYETKSGKWGSFDEIKKGNAP